MKIVQFFAAAIFATAIVSCGTTKNTQSAYYENNIADFSETALENGIPVVFKQNAGSQIAVVRVIFEGGTSNLSPQMSGLEDLTMDFIVHGSKNYPYQTIQRLSFDKSFGFSSASGKEFATAGLTCIKRDLEESLSILCDGILNPLFLEKDYSQFIKIAQDSIKSIKTNPQAVLGEAISNEIFKNHPYRADKSPTEESLKNLTLSAIKSYHKELLNAARMKIVIVGNLDADEKKGAISILNDTLGAISSRDFEKTQIPAIETNGETVREICEAAGETGYIEGIFPCPQRTDADYVPYAIATMMIDDSIFRIVREENGMVYSAGTGVLGASRFAGAISLFKTTKFEKVGETVKKALADFPKNEKQVAEKLNQYKNQFITTIFDNARTASGLAANITASWIYRGSPSAYLNRPAEVENTTAAQVLEAYQKYIAPLADGSTPIRWVVVSGSSSVEKFEVE